MTGAVLLFAIAFSGAAFLLFFLVTAGAGSQGGGLLFRYALISHILRRGGGDNSSERSEIVSFLILLCIGSLIFGVSVAFGEIAALLLLVAGVGIAALSKRR